MTPQPGGGFAAIEFANDLGSNMPVTMAFGPYSTSQALYYTTYRNGGQIRRISH
jgi:hypothetical protein